MGDALTPERLAQIRAELAPEPNPTCRICGKPMVVGAADAGGASWNCPGGDWRNGKWTPFDDTPDRGFADAHYSRSEMWRSHPPKFAVELLAEVDRLTARVAELEARAGDVARIVGWMRTYPAVERSPGTVGCMTLAEAADAIERGDWRDAPLPPDPRDAERLNLLDYAGGLENTIENMLWNLGGVSSVCMGALDADFTFDESAARAALHDAVKLRREFLALRAAARAVLSLTGDEPMEEADAVMDALAALVGVDDAT